MSREVQVKYLGQADERVLTSADIKSTFGIDHPEVRAGRAWRTVEVSSELAEVLVELDGDWSLAPVDATEVTKADLMEQAKLLDVEGRSSMTKDELAAAILSSSQEEETQEAELPEEPQED